MDEELELEIEYEDLEEEIELEYEDSEEDINLEEESTEEEIELEEEYSIVNGDKNYLHIQNIASDIWVINHNLNKYPSVTVIDSSGNEVIGDIEYTDINNLTIKFKGSFKGQATLN